MKSQLADEFQNKDNEEKRYHIIMIIISTADNSFDLLIHESLLCLLFYSHYFSLPLLYSQLAVYHSLQYLRSPSIAHKTSSCVFHAALSSLGH